MEELPVRIEGFDISTIGGEHTVASMVVFEGGAPKKSDYRRFKVRGDLREEGSIGPDDFASMEEVLTRRLNRYLEQNDLSPHDGKRDASFSSLPSLIMIDGGKGQLAAGMRALQPFADLGVTIVSLAKREEEVFVPGRADPIELPRDSEGNQLLQRVRDEAHRFAIEHHRGRRDRAMTGSVLDELKGVGPARKRALLQHFGSPERLPAPPPARNSSRCPACLANSVGRSTSSSTELASADRHPAGGEERVREMTLVIITGHSGAGKSEAIAAFEDGGYFCVDNLPPRMIAGLGELFIHEGAGVESAAIVSDVRGGEYFDDLLAVLDDLERDGPEPHLLFLEADEETLLDRYKETRRRHPLAPEGRIVDGIRAERAELAPLRERADIVIDTTDLTGAELRRRIAEELLGTERAREAGADPAHLRLQERAAARRRPHPRRPLPAQPPLRPRAAPADRPGPGGARLRRVGDPGGRVLRPADAAARVPRPRLRRRGQEPPDDRDRLHRRPPPLGHRRRPDPPRPGAARRRGGQGRSTATWTSLVDRP